MIHWFTVSEKLALGGGSVWTSSLFERGERESGSEHSQRRKRLLAARRASNAFAHLHGVVHGLRRPLDEGELVLQFPLVRRVLLVVRVPAASLRLAPLFPLLLSLRKGVDMRSPPTTLPASPDLTFDFFLSFFALLASALASSFSCTNRGLSEAERGGTYSQVSCQQKADYGKLSCRPSLPRLLAFPGRGRSSWPPSPLPRRPPDRPPRPLPPPPASSSSYSSSSSRRRLHRRRHRRRRRHRLRWRRGLLGRECGRARTCRVNLSACNESMYRARAPKNSCHKKICFSCCMDGLISHFFFIRHFICRSIR